MLLLLWFRHKDRHTSTMAGLKGKWAMMAVLAVLCLSTPCTATQSTPVEQEEHAHVEDEPTDSSSSFDGGRCQLHANAPAATCIGGANQGGWLSLHTDRKPAAAAAGAVWVSRCVRATAPAVVCMALRPVPLPPRTCAWQARAGRQPIAS